MFNVGDRVKCIDAGTNIRISNGEIYVVVDLDNHNQVKLAGNHTYYSIGRFVLVNDERESVVLWTIVFRTPNGEVRSEGYPTKEQAEREEQAFRDIRGFEVLALKKITVRI